MGLHENGTQHVWKVRKLERSEDVGNCVNREVGIPGSGNTGKWEYREVGIPGSGNTGKWGYMPYEDCVMNNSKGK